MKPERVSNCIDNVPIFFQTFYQRMCIADMVAGMDGVYENDFSHRAWSPQGIADNWQQFWQSHTQQDRARGVPVRLAPNQPHSGMPTGLPDRAGSHLGGWTHSEN